MRLPAAVLLLAVCAAVPAEPAEAPRDSERTVRVWGLGRAGARPDVAVVTLGVHTEADTAARALESNSARMRGVVEAVRAHGIPAADVRTRWVQLSPRWSEPEPGGREPRLTGYGASNAVEARVRDLARLGSLLDAAVRAGGNTIDGIVFEVADPTSARRAAREAAMADARATAEQLATLAGARLGEVLWIQESSSGPRPGPMLAERAQAMAVPVEAGTETVEVAVEVSWRLEPGGGPAATSPSR